MTGRSVRTWMMSERKEKKADLNKSSKAKTRKVGVQRFKLGPKKTVTGEIRGRDFSLKL